MAILTLYLRLTISVAGPSDDRTPLTASFTISNDGYLPLRSVEAYCTLFHLRVGGAKADSTTGEEVPLGPGWKVDTLYPGEKMGIPVSNCFILPAESLNDAQIGLLVRYHPYLLPFWEPKVRSIVIVRSIGDNHFYWYSAPHEGTTK